MNYYEILEVSTNASKEVIKNAYRALIKKYHPDSYTGDKEFAQEKVKEINEAYETLIDDDKRLLYDYDNGFKIDPNAPKEEEQITVTYETEEPKVVKQEEKSKFDIRSFLKNKKAVVFSVIVLFICAFSIGLIIAGKTGEDVDNNKDTTNEVVENKTVDKEYHENNNTYKQNNKTDTNTNTTTKIIVQMTILEEYHKKSRMSDFFLNFIMNWFWKFYSMCVYCYFFHYLIF